MDHFGGARPSALTIARSTRVFSMWPRNCSAPGPVAVRQSSPNEKRSHDLSSTTRFRADYRMSWRPSSTAVGRQRSAAQQRREIGNRLDDGARLEAQFLGDLGGAALYPERVQAGGRGAVDVPGVYRDESEFRVSDLNALGAEIVNARANFEDLDFLNADDVVEQIADPGALRRRF